MLMEPIRSFIAAFIDFMREHPQWGGALTFAIALLESLPIFGYLLPGSLILTGIGALMGANILPLFDVMVWAIGGAIVGDGLSYLLGRHYHQDIRNLRIFRRYIHWLDRGQDFFTRHGGKSVFLGRFFGPLRPIIPVIAGMMNMRPVNFIVANVTSAILWAPAHLLPGVLIGTASAVYSPKKVIHFIVNLIIFLFLLWLVSLLLRTVMSRMSHMINRWALPCWRSLQAKKWWPKVYPLFYAQTYHEDEYLQLSLVFGILIFASLFTLFTLSDVHLGWAKFFDQDIYAFFSHWQQPWLTPIATAFTFLGDRRLLVVIVGVLFIFCLQQRARHAAFTVALTAVVSVGIVYVLKHALDMPRPEGFMLVATKGSYPSGHTTFSVVVYGLIALLARRELSTGARWFLYQFVLFLITAVCLSRLYLSSHWLSDLIGSVLLGSSLLLAAVFFYRRKPLAHLSSEGLLITLAITISLGVSGLLFNHYVIEGFPLTANCQNQAVNKIGPAAPEKTPCPQAPEDEG